MAEIRQRAEVFAELGVRVVAISADNRVKSESFRKELGYSIELLCDENREVIKQYHLLNTAEHGGIAYPAVFVVKGDGTIGYRSLDRTANRVELSEVMTYLWDLEKDPNLILRSESTKRFIIPAPRHLLQFGRNMFLRGNRDDWLHHLTVPLTPIKLLFKRK